ncbi:MAG: Gfo/Idh/MocA family oxidoreductase [Ruminococcaceae bacterium]|nr:Gfo/Idh/MocA family oxidoreductase [Oscillospiraceae bacterium]
MAQKDSNLYKFEQNNEVKVIDTSKKVRIGIIGTGWIADSHAEVYVKQPDVEIVALADLIPGKAEAFKNKWNMEGTRVYEGENAHLKMLEAEKLDAVSVCTYNRAHTVCTIDSLKHGLDVMLEKPMCVTMDEAVAIRKAEKETGKFVTIGFQPRYSPRFMQMKEIVQSGVLGKLYYVQACTNCRRHGIPTPFGTTFIEDKTAGLGALADIGCYSLDLVMNTIGYPKPLTVTGHKCDFFGKNPEYYKNPDHPEYAELFSVDDFASGYVRLEGGIILDFRIAWAMHMDTMGDTIILGTKAGLRIPGDGSELIVYSDMGNNRVKTVIPAAPEVPYTPFEGKLRAFIEAVKTGGPAPIPTSEIIKNQAIISGIAESCRVGGEIKIEIPEI